MKVEFEENTCQKSLLLVKLSQNEIGERFIGTDLRVNKDIRSANVRLITEDGEQLGIFAISDALKKATEMGLDLVEIAPTADPPVCKVIDYGKFRYQQTKRDKVIKKSGSQAKLKEIKLKPNIDKHDLNTKISKAKDFIEKGYKVKFNCMFRGREIVFADNGREVLKKVIEALLEVAQVESEPRMYGKVLTMMIAPLGKDRKAKDKDKENKSVQSENK